MRERALTDGNPGFAAGGVIPASDAATGDRPPAWLTGCPGATRRHDSGAVIPPGLVLLRNDTGRELGPDDLHLLTYIGPYPRQRLYTTDEVRDLVAKASEKLLGELLGTLDVDAGRTVPTSPVVDVALPAE